jgi:hypothetical protein
VVAPSLIPTKAGDRVIIDEFFIDLTGIGSGSKEKPDKAQLIHHFENVLNKVNGEVIEGALPEVGGNDEKVGRL